MSDELKSPCIPANPSVMRPTSGRWAILGLLVVVSAVIWLWRAQLSGAVVHIGNHDRLQSVSGLNHELTNYDSLARHGRLVDWNERVFGGVNHGAQISAGNNLSPLKLLMPWVGRGDFYRAAGFLPFVLMLASSLAAYVALRAVASPVASAVGALIYVTGTFAQLNFSQTDMMDLLLVCLPAGMVAIGMRPGDGRSLLVLTACTLPVVYLGFYPQSAYVFGFWGLLTLQRCWSLRSWRPLLLLTVSTALALACCWPRLLAVGTELGALERRIPGLDHTPNFAEVQSYFNVTGREFFRLFEDGIFGRFSQESFAWGNNLNMNEGFQLYSSTLATLLALTMFMRYRGQWLGAFHPRHGVVACCIWTLLLVVLVVFCPPVTYLVYRLFFSVPIVHARIVIIGLLPMAVLVAVGLDEWMTAGRAAAPRRQIFAVLTGLALAGLAAAGMQQLARDQAPAVRVANIDDPLGLVADAWCASSDVLAAPMGLEVRRPQSRKLWLQWRGSGPTSLEFEIEMRRDAGGFANIGRTQALQYNVGDIAFDGEYSFRVRARSGAAVSKFSAIAVAPANIISPLPAHPFDSAPSGQATPLWVNARRLAKLTACAILFALLLATRPLLGRMPGAMAGAGAGLAALIVWQALTEADFRVNGPHTRSFPVPFAGGNFFNAPPGTLRPPGDTALDDLHKILAPDRWRTAFITPDTYDGFAAPHIAEFWQLRMIEGYLSGVPRRIAALPWPAGTMSFRTLAFRRKEELPWPLLGLLNVRYAITIDTPLYFNVERNGALPLLENPGPVVPREFFARHTRPVPPFGNGPVQLPADPLQESFVENSDGPRAWASGGAIHATYADDRISVDFADSDAARFLVLNELYHSGWRAFTAGGQNLPIYPTNTCMRGIEIPPGTVHIDLKFNSGPSLIVSRLSASGALILLLLGIRLFTVRSVRLAN